MNGREFQNLLNFETSFAGLGENFQKIFRRSSQNFCKFKLTLIIHSIRINSF